MSIPSWISADAVTWFAFFAWLSATLLSIVRSDNPAISIEFSTRGKMVLVTVLGIAQAFFQTKVQPGVTWMQAIITALMSQGTALSAHGFRDTVTLPPSGGKVIPATESAPAMIVPTVPAPPATLRGFIRHFRPESAIARMTLAAGIIVMGFMMLCAFLSSGCTPAETALEQKIERCVIARFSSDLGGGMSPEVAAVDTAAFCITDELTVKRVMMQADADTKTLRLSAADAGK